MKSFLAAAFWLAAAAVPLVAATPPPLVVGNPPASLPNAGASIPAAPYTLIDASRPATATGNLTQVKLGWTGFPCNAVVRIRVFHRTGSTLTPAAQTAALSLVTPDAHSIFTQTLSPPLPIQQGDLIGMTTLTDCGNPLVYHGFPTIGYLLYGGDVQGPVSFDNPLQVNTDQLALGATGVMTQYTALVVPGVGSLAGAFGSQFKTSLQIIAPQFGGGVTGKLVFHPSGVSGSSTDPSIPLSLGEGRAVSYANVVATMGQTGLGSLDIVLDASSSVPIAYARVFNDAGAGGTSGLGEAALDVTQSFVGPASSILAIGCTGYISAPADPARQRLTVGIRSLDTFVTVSFALKSQEGATRTTTQRHLQPNEFLQLSGDALFGIAPGANDYIEVSATGDAIVYGAATDNTTNDPSVQFASPVACVA